MSRPRGMQARASRQSRENPSFDCRELALSPMSDLDLMIENGWGDTPQERLPTDWRTRIKAPNGNIKPGRRKAATA